MTPALVSAAQLCLPLSPSAYTERPCFELPADLILRFSDRRFAFLATLERVPFDGLACAGGRSPSDLDVVSDY